MKNIKTYVDESLFAGDIEDKIKDLNASLTLPQPKNPVEYLNYMCAWNKILAELYDMTYDDTGGLIKHSGEFLSYIFRLYFANLPKFHLEVPSEWSLSGDENEKVPIYRINIYDTKMDDVIVKRDRIKINQSAVDNMIEKLSRATKEREIMKFRDVLTDIVYGGAAAKMMPGYVCSAEAWTIAHRAEGISQLSASDAPIFLRNFNYDYLKENRNNMLKFLSKIKLAMEKSQYREESTRLFRNIYRQWA
jgi:hypothetical protein